MDEYKLTKSQTRQALRPKMNDHAPLAGFRVPSTFTSSTCNAEQLWLWYRAKINTGRVTGKDTPRAKGNGFGIVDCYATDIDILRRVFFCLEHSDYGKPLRGVEGNQCPFHHSAPCVNCSVVSWLPWSRKGQRGKLPLTLLWNGQNQSSVLWWDLNRPWEHGEMMRNDEKWMITHDGSGSVCHINGLPWPPSTKTPNVSINLPYIHGSVMGSVASHEVSFENAGRSIHKDRLDEVPSRHWARMRRPHRNPPKDGNWWQIGPRKSMVKSMVKLITKSGKTSYSQITRCLFSSASLCKVWFWIHILPGISQANEVSPQAWSLSWEPARSLVVRSSQDFDTDLHGACRDTQMESPAVPDCSGYIMLYHAISVMSQFMV